MRTLKRDEKTIYVCHRYKDGNLIKYKNPIPINEHYATTDTEADLIAMGMEYSKRLRIKASNRVCIDGQWCDRATMYHQGDKVYVYTKPPVEHDVLCKTADYEVEVDPIVTPNQMGVTLVKLSGKDKS